MTVTPSCWTRSERRRSPGRGSGEPHSIPRPAWRKAASVMTDAATATGYRGFQSRSPVPGFGIDFPDYRLEHSKRRKPDPERRRQARQRVSSVSLPGWIAPLGLKINRTATAPKAFRRRSRRPADSVGRPGPAPRASSEAAESCGSIRRYHSTSTLERWARLGDSTRPGRDRMRYPTATVRFEWKIDDARTGLKHQNERG